MIDKIIKFKRNWTFVPIILGIFLLLNAFKITIFNIFVLYYSNDLIIYKFIISFILILIINLILLNTKKYYFFIGFYLIQALYIFINLSYYLYFKTYLHFNQIVLLFGETIDIINSFAIPLDIRLLIILIDLPFFVFIIKKYPQLNSFIKDLKYKKIFISGLIIFLILVHQIVLVNNKVSLDYIKNSRYRGDKPLVESYGTLVNFALGIFEYGDEEKIINEFDYGKKIDSEGNNLTRPNFILIQVESLDANLINNKYNDSFITPFLNSIKNKSIYYPYMRVLNKAGGSSDAEFSVINSLAPSINYPSFKLKNYDYPNSMLKRLKNGSYHILGFHNNYGYFYNRESAYPKMGFDEFYDLRKMRLKEEGWGASDKAVFDFVKNKLKEQKNPFFYQIVTMSSHPPFKYVDNYYHNDIYDNVPGFMGDYFNSMSYVDGVLEDFINFVDKNLNNTYILIYGDHGLYSGNKFLKAARIFVPLIIITPDKKIYQGNNNDAVSFLDIAPTVLFNSGIAFEMSSDGKNLLKKV